MARDTTAKPIEVKFADAKTQGWGGVVNDSRRRAANGVASTVSGSPTPDPGRAVPGWFLGGQTQVAQVAGDALGVRLPSDYLTVSTNPIALATIVPRDGSVRRAFRAHRGLYCSEPASSEPVHARSCSPGRQSMWTKFSFA